MKESTASGMPGRQSRQTVDGRQAWRRRETRETRTSGRPVVLVVTLCGTIKIFAGKLSAEGVSQQRGETSRQCPAVPAPTRTVVLLGHDPGRAGGLGGERESEARGKLGPMQKSDEQGVALATATAAGTAAGRQGLPSTGRFVCRGCGLVRGGRAEPGGSPEGGRREGPQRRRGKRHPSTSRVVDGVPRVTGDGGAVLPLPAVPELAPLIPKGSSGERLVRRPPELAPASVVPLAGNGKRPAGRLPEVRPSRALGYGIVQLCPRLPSYKRGRDPCQTGGSRLEGRE
ncbi:hypothetical protein THAOC_29737 [Thalassiosira oceanica]|uniref:Uncharacterized protein n=1 Tax=Thalassiosira oceanica TaxID=159749 RepID=K0RD62_THAOC|nr:hypothetical protein THAOC_29737 [Thalassiosira oceanica]|eukprot:EJK51125.1 hypothetical protein THAOC_29737 [Thalassiosira oceanica]